MTDALDMRDTIIPKSDQLNADDLIGGAMTVAITKVSRANTAEQPIAVSFAGDGGKPYMPCKSMRRVMVAVWGIDASAYVGRSMTLYRDADVTWGGMAVGGIRISHMSHMDGPVTLALTATNKARKPYRVLPLVIAEPVAPAEPATKPKWQQIVEAFRAVKTADDYYRVIDTEGERIAWLKQNKPEQFAAVDVARADAAAVMQEHPDAPTVDAARERTMQPAEEAAQ